MDILQRENERLRKEISKSCKEIKFNTQAEYNFRRLAKLRQAKIAVIAITRAATKNNFMLLNTLYECPDLDRVLPECPALQPYIEYVHKKCVSHNAKYMDDKTARKFTQK